MDISGRETYSSRVVAARIWVAVSKQDRATCCREPKAAARARLTSERQALKILAWATESAGRDIDPVGDVVEWLAFE
jgi:hypothetical protein